MRKGNVMPEELESAIIRDMNRIEADLIILRGLLQERIKHGAGFGSDEELTAWKTAEGHVNNALYSLRLGRDSLVATN